jgi:DNA-directed RNA polymerase specialized sigma24 family protein
MRSRNLGELQRVLIDFMYRRDLSAQELAQRIHCSLPSVYRRIDRLRELGAEIKETKEPRKKTGPTPTKYRLVRFN